MTWILALYVIVGNPVGVRYFLKKIKVFLLIPVLLVHLYCVTSSYKALSGTNPWNKAKGALGAPAQRGPARAGLPWRRIVLTYGGRSHLFLLVSESQLHHI